MGAGLVCGDRRVACCSPPMMESGLWAVAHVDVVGEAGGLAAGKLTAGEASRDGGWLAWKQAVLTVAE